LDYTYGLDKIYSLDEIEKAKKSPSFEREYNLKYLGVIGNVFHEKDIQRAIEIGKSYILKIYQIKILIRHLWVLTVDLAHLLLVL
jgi:hypothetical protein